ncbi:hypothetical protein J7J62_08675 [bacterium]|nr:hypothetical protein [bacterium]
MSKGLLKFRDSMTLTEILVAMVLVGVLLSATFYVFSNFFSATFSHEKVSLEQVDIQVATDFTKWDIMMAGFGLPSQEMPIEITDNGGYNGSDIVTLRATSFGVGGKRARWTYILSPSVGVPQITVRRWDNRDDLVVGDVITILTPTGQRVGMPRYRVVSLTPTIMPDSTHAYIVQLDNIVSTGRNFVFPLADTSGEEVVTYSLSGDTLYRNNDAFVSNVADFQVSFWLDLDGDRQQDSDEIVYDLSSVISNPSLIKNIRLVKLNVLTATPQAQSYVTPFDSIVVCNNVVHVSDIGEHKRYNIWESSVCPRNF